MESSWLVSGYRVQGLGLEVGKGVRLEPMILLVMGVLHFNCYYLYMGM